MNFHFFERSKRIYVAVFVFALFALVMTCIPYLIARIKAGNNWANVTPALSYDALRYYARANDVTRGNFYPHDPYFIEHRATPSPTPSLDDVIVAIPQLAGLSFNASYYVSIFFWCLIFFALATYLLFQFTLSLPLSIFGAVWAYLGVYNDMLRPGAMQIVFPLFLLFLIFFYRFIVGSKKGILPLGIISGMSAYFYIYLFMTAFAIMGVYSLFQIFQKKWSETKKMILAASLGGITAIPHFVNVFELSHLAYYEETMVRIVFLSSRWPQIEAYYYGRWVILGMLIICLTRRYFPLLVIKTPSIFFLYVGGGILVAMVSNVFMGRDFDIAVHVGRFGILWYLLLGVVLLSAFTSLWREHRGNFVKALGITSLFSLLVLQMFLNIPRATGVFFLDRKDVIEVQEYRDVVDWLSQQPESVVLAPEKLMMYLPTLAKQYVLFNSHGSLFLMSDQELRERYLLAHAFDRLTVDQFVDRRPEYDGPVPSLLAKTSLLKYRLCTFFSLSRTCGVAKQERDFVDVDRLRSQFNAYYPNLLLNILREYTKYHVRYIVFRTDGSLPLELRGACDPAYHDRYFSVCVLNTSS